MSSLRQFRKDLRTYLIADTTVNALIGTRLYSVRGKQEDAKPYVVMQIIDGRDELTHSGPVQLPEYRVQFSIYGTTSDSNDAVRDAIHDRLCPDAGLNGLIGTSTQVAWAIVDNDLDDDEEDSNLKSHIIDFRIRLK